MNIRKLDSLQELREALEKVGKRFHLIYRDGSRQSDCALESLVSTKPGTSVKEILTADVNNVRDIHGNYGIESVPVLLEFENTKLVNTYKGCNSSDFYSVLLSGEFSRQASSDKQAQKSVTVYSTPTCSWCNTLKSYLREKGITFRDIDVSADSSAAEAMVRRSGQQGVPQTDINGQVIVGFDKKKIDDILGIRPGK